MGRLAYVKGHDLLIRAWVHVHARHPDWSLRIVGAGPRAAKLQMAIDKRGLRNRVLLEGAARDVGAELDTASLFVLGSRRQGMPMVILEAMSKGLPVISYDCPTGPAELITHGFDGLLVESGKIHAMADAICTLIENEELRRQLGARALNTSARYRPTTIAAMWDQLLADLIDKKTRGVSLVK
ncbi:glycosyltransferase [Nonomuraea sp. NPDC049129]|uniref:glycosyltransferase n=1 Tax=Nonomuraea sp. NPDC049129 TaxID=3155272 RepID=UPI0033E2D618